jgi:hypothetical protein
MGGKGQLLFVSERKKIRIEGNEKNFIFHFFFFAKLSDILGLLFLFFLLVALGFYRQC